MIEPFHWRDPDRRMPRADIEPLLKAFYGTIERFAGDKAKMRRVWQLARGYVVDDGQGDKDWAIGRPLNLQGAVELVTLRAHTPIPGNDGTMRLSLTLVITPDDNVTYRGRAVTIGLTDAWLCMDSESWQPTWRSLVSERDHPNFRLSAAGARIVGPRDTAIDMIDGEPLGDEHLAVVEPIGIGGGPINVAIRAPRDSFRVLVGGSKGTQGSPPEHVSSTQKLVLSALFHEQLHDRDDRDRAVLARVTVHPRSA